MMMHMNTRRTEKTTEWRWIAKSTGKQIQQNEQTQNWRANARTTCTRFLLTAQALSRIQAHGHNRHPKNAKFKTEKPESEETLKIEAIT